MISAKLLERPILFSGPMVRAILEGRKTMTRRVVKIAQDARFLGLVTRPLRSMKDEPVLRAWMREPDESSVEITCPYGAPGDRLWVREAYRLCSEADAVRPRDTDAGYRVWCEADAPHQPGFGKLRPSMFMPRWASRITLEVTGVRVERLQDISEEDAIAEGIYKKTGRTPIGDVVETIDRGEMIYTHNGMARDEFAYVWDKINAARGFGWDANPFVWVVEFKRLAAIEEGER